MNCRLSALIIATGMLLACQGNSRNTTESSVTTSEQQVVSAPFSVDSAYLYLQTQVAFGPRTPGSQAHKTCGDWLVTTMKRWGYTVQEQVFLGKDFHGQEVKGRNIISSLSPEKSERILLMAHWDTRVVADQDSDATHRSQPIDGADDGASGVGTLLELARQWSLQAPRVGIDIIFFDLEDGGHSGDNYSWCLGSQYWAKHPHTPNYTAKAGILLDMVGARGAKFHWEDYSKTYAAPLLMDVWETAKEIGHASYFPNSLGGSVMDDHVPVIEHRHIPTIDIVNFSIDGERTGFGAHWHTQQDNMSIIDKATLQAVGQTVATYIANY